FGTRSPADGGVPVDGGSMPASISQGLIGLASGTQYWFCALAENSGGAASGSVLTFTTSASADAGADGGFDSDAGAGGGAGGGAAGGGAAGGGAAGGGAAGGGAAGGGAA